MSGSAVSEACMRAWRERGPTIRRAIPIIHVTDPPGTADDKWRVLRHLYRTEPGMATLWDAAWGPREARERYDRTSIGVLRAIIHLVHYGGPTYALRGTGAIHDAPTTGDVAAVVALSRAEGDTTGLRWHGLLLCEMEGWR